MGHLGRLLWVALLAPFMSIGQQPSDFAGEWRMDPLRSESAHQDVPIGPVTLLVKVSPTEVTIETRRAGKGKLTPARETLTFHLDGSENVIGGTSGAPVKTKAHLDGGKLVTETARNIQGSTITTMQVFSLDPNGKELTVDKTLTVQHGYQSPGPDANNTGRGRDVFVRSRAAGKK